MLLRGPVPYSREHVTDPEEGTSKLYLLLPTTFIHVLF
jgi:hypothetical protein